MIKFLDILKESDDNIFIPRGSKEEKDKVLIRRINDKIEVLKRMIKYLK